MKRNLEVLISALEKDPFELASHMNLECDAVIVNQTGRDHSFEFKTGNGASVRVLESCERGVGRSRNAALSLADSKIVLFSDDDIVYKKGYADSILKAFSSDPKADIILFNFEVPEERKTYQIEKPVYISKWSVGRYPAYAAACRLESIRSAGIRFSLLFGGGAKYSNGEDSLFFMDCLRAGLTIKAVPVVLGKEKARKSTWFNGYTEKFFIDRGVLFHYLYGKYAGIWALRFVLVKKRAFNYPFKISEAYRLMKAGIKEGRETALDQEGRK